MCLKRFEDFTGGQHFMIPNPRPLMEKMDRLLLSEAHSFLKAVRQGRLHHVPKLPDKLFVQRTGNENF